jgi:divalent metal cation (Fe/Co/Zn/Cd) transporter
MSPSPTPQQRDQERSVQFALTLDVATWLPFVLFGVMTGALTILAEAIRGAMVIGIETFALLVMKRIHRGRTAVFEFGSGKIEQAVNMLLGVGMLIGAAWIALSIVHLLTGTADVASQGGYALAAILASINTCENAVAWDAVRRAAKSGGSLIMQGQLRVRFVKFASSLLVQTALTVATLSTDRGVVAWADALGAVVVTIFIVHSAIGMMKAGLPDLLDQSVNEETQVAINRVLARHFDDYDRLDRVRTRRSGNVVYAEIALAFRSDLTIDEVNRRIAAMKASLNEEISGADISILAEAC